MSRWQPIPGPIDAGLAEFYARDGYLIVPKLVAEDGKLRITKFRIYAPSIADTGRPIFYRSRDVDDGHDAAKTLERCKRDVRDLERKRISRRRRGVSHAL